MKTILALMSLVLFFSAHAHAGFVNGDFSSQNGGPDVFTGWTTDDSLFDRPTNGGNFALFGESGQFGSSQLAQAYALTSGTLSISFEFKISATGSFAGSIRDSFQATLFDSFGHELFPSNAPLFTAFYSADNDVFSEFYDPLFVTSQDLGGGVKRITLDVSTLLPQDLVIDFLLNGSDDGISTSVGLDNVILNNQINAVPEPDSLLIWGICIGLGLVFQGWRFKSITNQQLIFDNSMLGRTY